MHNFFFVILLYVFGIVYNSAFIYFFKIFFHCCDVKESIKYTKLK